MVLTCRMKLFTSEQLIRLGSDTVSPFVDTSDHHSDYGVADEVDQHADVVEDLHYVADGLDEVDDRTEPVEPRTQLRVAVLDGAVEDASAALERSAQLFVADVEDLAEELEGGFYHLH
jgi:hypothetical protein